MTPAAGAGLAVDPGVETAILDALGQQHYLPIELMDALEKKGQISDAPVKAAILALLQQKLIEFGPDQKLRRVEAAAVR